MNQNFSMKAFLKKLRSDELILALGMPMGYMPGMPVLHEQKGEVCITIPFFRRRVSKKSAKDKNAMIHVVETYPVRYSVTYALRPIKLPELDSSKPSSLVLAPNEEFLSKTITEGKVISFTDLSYRDDYMRMYNGERSAISPEKPIGIFRADKNEYEKQLEEIYSLYDKAINTRLYDKKIDGAAEARLVNKLIVLLGHEPSIRPFYLFLDGGSFAKKLSGAE